MAGVINDYGNAEWVDKRRVYTDTQMRQPPYKSTIWVDEASIEGALTGYTAAQLAVMNLNDKRYALRVQQGCADTEPGSYP